MHTFLCVIKYTQLRLSTSHWFHSRSTFLHSCGFHLKPWLLSCWGQWSSQQIIVPCSLSIQNCLNIKWKWLAYNLHSPKKLTTFHSVVDRDRARLWDNHKPAFSSLAGLDLIMPCSPICTNPLHLLSIVWPYKVGVGSSSEIRIHTGSIWYHANLASSSQIR